MNTKKTPTLAEPLKKEMNLIKKKLDKLTKLADKRVEYEEDTYGYVSDSTMDKLTLIGRMNQLLKDFSHLL